MTRLRRVAAGGTVVVLSGCAGSLQGNAEPAHTAVSVPTTIENYPDAITRELARQAAARRPVEPSAVPPRHLDAEAFPTTLVDRNRIVSGGPPVDGIASLDAPVFEPVGEVDWLDDDEAVMVLVVDGDARAYPAQVMIWHEIVNDTFGDLAVAVTYCPLCNSGLAFVREIDGVVTEFGTSGVLFQSNLVMYDRLTESLWTQFDGRSVVGTSVGTELDQLALSTVSFADFRDAHPAGQVLSRNTGFDRPYGRNPYNTYDQRDTPLPGFYVGETDGTLVPFQRVIGITTADATAAIQTVDVADAGVVTARVGEVPVTIWHSPGTASPLNNSSVADGDDIGATGVFDARLDGELLEFERRDTMFVDEATGSTWNVLGRAVAGPLTGRSLDPVVHVDTFWFSWATFHVEAVLIRP